MYHQVHYTYMFLEKIKPTITTIIYHYSLPISSGAFEGILRIIQVYTVVYGDMWRIGHI